MLSPTQARQLVALVVPVHFQSGVKKETIVRILEATFADQHLFCAPQRVVVIVDRDTPAETVLREASPGSSLHGLQLHVLEKNLGKAGAIRVGLAELLNKSDVPYFVTRDCDGDHSVEDLPRLVGLAEHIREDTSADLISVFGIRASLEKPMGWFREEWERLTNRTLADLADFLRSQEGKVADKRYWNGFELDAQSGYRLYSRRAAGLTVGALAELPEDPAVFTFACEPVPFLDLTVQGGITGQVQRLTRVEQPVSSFQGVAFARCYGGLLAYVCRRYQVSPPVLLQMFDNHLVTSSLYFSEFREQLLECRRHILPAAPPVRLPRFV